MDIKSSDVKKLVIEHGKGDIVLMLPIGLQLEEALTASHHFSGTLTKAIELIKEKKKEEEDNVDSNTDTSSD